MRTANARPSDIATFAIAACRVSGSHIVVAAALAAKFANTGELIELVIGHCEILFSGGHGWRR